ncbi:MAG: NADH-quinone oxidoreductase subunit J [Opitutae bacterium]|jgi:NADH-quinone oxidoreductase subunit J|nr:NADH-quinone oxidoreductase subunit J [Opitutae bacterium]MBT6461561.1 NADH-quinone oxidoreductase subunit J [Opitutae bacterium]MBT7853760.1 NADH-quinone oxidoreductase subunit J [Opitutae bacterium]
MLNLLFYIFATMTLVPAFLMVTSRSPVSGAMYMIASFVGMACLFVLLEAFFLAILQVLVYAGAIMVLFLFIIMLLDMDEAEDLRTKSLPSMAAMIAFGLLLVTVLSFFKGSYDGPLSPIQATTTTTVVTEAIDLKAKPPALPFSTKARTFGYGLFTKYMLPFQVTGILLLIAMVGVIVLSKRHEAQGGKQEG